MLMRVNQNVPNDETLQRQQTIKNIFDRGATICLSPYFVFLLVVCTIELQKYVCDHSGIVCRSIPGSQEI